MLAIRTQQIHVKEAEERVEKGIERGETPRRRARRQVSTGPAMPSRTCSAIGMRLPHVLSRTAARIEVVELVSPSQRVGKKPAASHRLTNVSRLQETYGHASSMYIAACYFAFAPSASGRRASRSGETPAPQAICWTMLCARGACVWNPTTNSPSRRHHRTRRELSGRRWPWRGSSPGPRGCTSSPNYLRTARGRRPVPR